MNRIGMSPAAAALLRALLERGGDRAERILLSDVRSTDWQSLTFTGERHCFGLRIAGPDAEAVVERLTAGLEDAEFSLAGQIVADIALSAPPTRLADGSILVAIEALTIAD